MQDYKRIVSYIHTYENNEKKKNVGFGKLEARNGMGKLSIKISGQDALSGKLLCVYLLHMNSKEYLKGIRLGTVRAANGSVNSEFRFNTENIMQSGFKVSQIQGIYVTTEEAPHAVFASSWTDADIVPERFVEDAKPYKMNPSVLSAELKSDVDMKEEKTDTQTEEKETESETGKTGEQAGEAEEKPKTEKTDGPAEETEAESEVESEVEKINEHAVETECTEDENEGIVSAAVISKISGAAPCENELLTSFMESLNGMGGFEEDELLHNMEFESEPSFKTPWEELCSKYPKVIAFEKEGEIPPHRMCLKIDLKDLEAIENVASECRENIYMIRSYYKYKYLLLIENEKDSEGKSCILGIPGIYCKNDANMAQMFNFENFYPAKNLENANGSFGYWCKEIKL